MNNRTNRRPPREKDHGANIGTAIASNDERNEGVAGRQPATAKVRFAEKCRPTAGGCIEWTGAPYAPVYKVFNRLTWRHI